MPDRYQIFDLKANNLAFTAQPLRTKAIARQVRREMARLTGEPVRFIVIPGPEHRKWKPGPSTGSKTHPTSST